MIPPGLVFAPDGTLSGTPTTAGDYSMLATVTDSESPPVTVGNAIVLHINPAGPAPLVIDTTSAPAGGVGTPLSDPFSAHGGTAPYHWSATALPPGLTVSSVGVLSGTPTAGGDYSIHVTLTDSASPQNTATGSVAIHINLAALVIDTTSVPPGTIGVSLSDVFSAHGGVFPYIWSATSLPPGLAVSAAGVLSGIPTTAGNYSIKAAIGDSATPPDIATGNVSISIGSTVPVFDHIVLVALENQDYSSIIGSPSCPYINSLATAGANFTNMHALTHPSFSNYFALFSGSLQGNHGDVCPPPGQPYTPSLGGGLIAAGKTFGGYAEGMPAVKGCSGNGNYDHDHVPWIWFSDTPFSVSHDFTAFPQTAPGFAALPTVSMVVPGDNNNMHSGTLAASDAWVQSNLGAYATWAKTNNSLLILWWDEAGADVDGTNHVATIFYGQHVQPGSYSETINHYSILRTIEDAYGLPRIGSSATAAPITDCWTAGPPPPQQVPAFDHILIVVMENHGVNQIIGNTTNAPYINGLLPRAAYFSQSYAIRHPSSPSYLALFSGSTQGITVNYPTPSQCPPPGAPYNAPNLAGDLIAAGKTFGGYAMSIPTNPLDCTSSIYDPNHVPWLRFSNIPTTGAGSIAHNFTSFPTNPTGFAALPAVAWAVPDGNNSMESSSTLPAAITQGDNFLRNNIDAYITWAETHNSLLILTWDEDQGFLNGNGGSPTGGGHVVTMFLGAHVVPGTYAEASIAASVGVPGIDSYNLLRTIEVSCGLPYRGNAATAVPVTDCWD